MELTLEADALKRALTAIKPAIPKPGALPVLSGVRITTNPNGTVELVATDLEKIAVVSVNAEVLRPGQLVVNHKLLAEAAAGAKGRTVKVSQDPDETDAPVEFAHRITRRMRSLPADEFPRVNIDPDTYNTDVIAVDPADLKRITVAASNDDHRPILTGVSFSPAGMVGTDSYRLHVINQGQTAGTYLVPKGVCERAATEAKGEAVVVRFSADGRSVKLSGASGVDWYSRTIEGEYPNWPGLIPSTQATTVTVNTKEFREIVTEVGAITKGESTCPVRLTLGDAGDGLSVHATVQDVGDADGVIHQATIDGPGGLTVAFNLGFLLECANWPAEKITIGLVDHLKPVIFRPVDRSDALALLMPVRTQ